MDYRSRGRAFPEGNGSPPTGRPRVPHSPAPSPACEDRGPPARLVDRSMSEPMGGCREGPQRPSRERRPSSRERQRLSRRHGRGGTRQVNFAIGIVPRQQRGSNCAQLSSGRSGHLTPRKGMLDVLKSGPKRSRFEAPSRFRSRWTGRRVRPQRTTAKSARSRFNSGDSADRYFVGVGDERRMNSLPSGSAITDRVAVNPVRRAP